MLKSNRIAHKSKVNAHKKLTTKTKKQQKKLIATKKRNIVSTTRVTARKQPVYTKINHTISNNTLWNTHTILKRHFTSNYTAIACPEQHKSTSFIQQQKQQQQGDINVIDEHIPDSVLFPLPQEYVEYMKQTNDERFFNSEQYWLEQADLLTWFKKPTIGLKKQLPGNEIFHEWYPDGEVNLCYNALDVNIQKGLGDTPAFYYENIYMPNKNCIMTYNELLDGVNVICNALLRMGLQKGSRAMFYMPMTLEHAQLLLACQRLGIITSNTYGGFVSNELCKRINAFEPDIIFSASCGVEPNKIINYQTLMNGALNDPGLIFKPKKVVYQNRPEFLDLNINEMDQDRDVLLDDFVIDPLLGKPNHTHVDAIPLESSHPSYVAYTSGTSGTPKGLVRDSGGIGVMLKHSMQHVFNNKPGDTFFACSDFSWVAGLSLALLGPLLNHGSSVILEGKPVLPTDKSILWRLLTKYKATSCFIAPTAIRAIKQLDPNLDEAQIYKDILHQNNFTMYLAGEKSDRNSLQWLQQHLNIPTIDHYWQSESGAPITCMSRSIHMPHHVKNAMEQYDINPFAVRFGTAGFPTNGYSVVVKSDITGETLKPNQEGTLALKLPLPPGFMTKLFNDKDDKRYKKYFETFPGYYDLADHGSIDDDGAVSILGRADGVFNTAGHRLSSGSIEEAAQKHPSLAENCCIPIVDNIKGQLPIIFSTLKLNNQLDHKIIEKEVIQTIRQTVGPIAAPKRVIFVEQLPKTRSGKILRGTISSMINYFIYIQQHHATAPDELDRKLTIQQFRTKFDPNRAIWDKIVPYPTTIDNAPALEQFEQLLLQTCEELLKDSLNAEEVEKLK